MALDHIFAKILNFYMLYLDFLGFNRGLTEKWPY